MIASRLTSAIQIVIAIAHDETRCGYQHDVVERFVADLFEEALSRFDAILVIAFWIEINANVATAATDQVRYYRLAAAPSRPRPEMTLAISLGMSFQ